MNTIEATPLKSNGAGGLGYVTRKEMNAGWAISEAK